MLDTSHNFPNLRRYFNSEHFELHLQAHSKNRWDCNCCTNLFRRCLTPKPSIKTHVWKPRFMQHLVFIVRENKNSFISLISPECMVVLLIGDRVTCSRLLLCWSRICRRGRSGCWSHEASGRGSACVWPADGNEANVDTKNKLNPSATEVSLISSEIKSSKV